MKKINQLVLKAFLGPFVLTFFISMFVLLMQFLWKYIDELVGKGLDTFLVIKLLFYASATLVPLALPLSLLLSSIMTFGNLAEQYELVACKSAGLSLQRVMRPLIVTTLFICGAAFYFANNILPIANYKMFSLRYDVKKQKPALYIKEGIFYNGLDGYIVRVNKKNKDGKTLEGIMIYDHTDGRGNTKLIEAESGRMVMSDDERYLILTLQNGTSYEEQRPGGKQDAGRPFTRSEFESQSIRFDLSSFKMSRTDESLFKDNYQMLNLAQLQHAEDSILAKVSRRTSELARNLQPLKTSATPAPEPRPLEKEVIRTYPPEERSTILSAAITSARNYKSYAHDAALDIEGKSKLLYRHQIEWHRKFSLSIACLILFFIGAPLGAIIRKGGLGMPVVVSIIFFVTYHIVNITFEKFVREGILPASEGMWASSILFFPLGVFLTYKATTDSTLFDIDAYLRFFRKKKKSPQP